MEDGSKSSGVELGVAYFTTTIYQLAIGAKARAMAVVPFKTNYYEFEVHTQLHVFSENEL